MATVAEISKAPIPEEGESFERYTIRAHQSLMGDVADPDERNELVWAAWERHRGPQPEREFAAKAFPADKFTLSPGHCHFVEHETVAKDGKPRKYTVKDLAEIARQHNSEIRESQHFPALSNGHTPDNPEAPEPDLLGHAGPYRLGMIGRDKPRFALFSDEYHRQDSADTLSKKPFRSVELWTFKDGRRRFHPIAAVGSESPRLLMPAKYDAAHDPDIGQFDDFQHEGALVERYTVAAVGPEAEVERIDVATDIEKYEAAMAGGSNTFVKGPVASKENYADVQGPDTPDGIRAIMQAIQSTPEFTFLRKLMEEDSAMAGDDDQLGGDSALEGMDGDGMEDLGGDDNDADDVPAEHGSQAPDTSDLDDVMPADEEPEKHSLQSGPLEGDDMSDVVSVEKFTALQRNHDAVVEKYTALQKSHDQLIGHTKKLNERLQAVERTATDAARRAEIDGLAEKYSMAFDPEAEYKKCLYSQGSSMTDEAFKERMDTYKEIGDKFVNSPMVPRGVLPDRYTNRAQAEVEKYEQRLSQEAIKVHDENLKQGKNLPWDACAAEAKKRISQNGHAAATA